MQCKAIGTLSSPYVHNHVKIHFMKQQYFNQLSSCATHLDFVAYDFEGLFGAGPRGGASVHSPRAVSPAAAAASQVMVAGRLERSCSLGRHRQIILLRLTLVHPVAGVRRHLNDVIKTWSRNTNWRRVHLIERH